MVGGNFEDKYNTKNPIAKFLVLNFISRFKILLGKVKNPQKIVELGTGEGELVKILCDKFPEAQIFACDISKKIIKIAQKNLKNKKVVLSVEDIEKLSYKDNQFDLVICAEVLEHVNNPAKALAEIKRISKGSIILSVPKEPLWRILNIVRLKYLKDFGNTPGHLNHWSSKSFIDFVQKMEFRVKEIINPFPWTMILLKNKI